VVIERSVIDNRRQLGAFAVLAIVLLRLAIGWHFFTAGAEKIEPKAEGGYRVSFSAAPFLGMAQGPFANSFKAMVPSGHDWQKLLAVPHQKKPLTAEEAKAAGENPPYEAWAERIKSDWQAMTGEVEKVPGLVANQIEQAKAIAEAKKSELDDYLEGEASTIVDYQHELWRLDQWRAKPEATTLPFEEERIAKKAADTTAKAKGVVAGVAALEADMVGEFRNLVGSDPKSATTANAMEAATTGPEEAKLARVNLGATILTLGVGICLLLGLFTRTASIAGGIFLLSVIASQPPWISDPELTIHQIVELAGLLVLAGTGAGRWLGLDYFSWALFHKNDD
jgi:uncharacterized membrane protein YphA (DoxX/SURF4 family)